MGPSYVVQWENATFGAKTLIWINPGTTRAIEIFRFFLSQSGTSTQGQCRVQAVTQVSAFPTVTGFTPRPLRIGDAASVIVSGTGAAGTAGINASLENAGAKTILFERDFSNLNGTEWVSNGKDGIVVPASSTSGFGLYMPAAPASTTGWSAAVFYREL